MKNPEILLFFKSEFQITRGVTKKKDNKLLENLNETIETVKSVYFTNFEAGIQAEKAKKRAHK